jgi:hypothetical protein
MKNLLLVPLVALSLFACGPDAVALVGDDDGELDGTEAYDAALTSTSRSTTWLPFEEGNSWTFRSTAGSTRTVTLTEVHDGVAKLSGLFPEPVYVGLTSGTSTTLQQWTGSGWVPLVRFGYASTSWRTSSAACTGLVGKRTATGALVTTAADSFQDTRTIGFAQVSSPTMLCAAPAFNELTFAANVGLVAFRTGTNQRFTLVSAKVNGKVFPVPASADVTARVTLDQASYTSMPNTIRCVTAPCASNAQTAIAKVSFSIMNAGTTSRTWQFSTGCQYDVELVSMAGTVVRRLSEGRSCTYALSSLTLGAGQSKSFVVSMPLEDRNGLQLDGTYTVRAKLIPSGSSSPALSASTSLPVQVLAP